MMRQTWKTGMNLAKPRIDIGFATLRGGNVIGPLMSYEVLTAFFLEAGFLGIMLFGWKRVPKGVHFFATWCEPCRAEMASLRALQSRLAGAPFAIVPVSVAEADGAVRRFFAGESLPFAILLDRDRAVARAWNVQTLPSTVVLDRTLKPRFIAEGDVDWARPDVTKILADLLMEVPG